MVLHAPASFNDPEHMKQELEPLMGMDNMIEMAPMHGAQISK